MKVSVLPPSLLCALLLGAAAVPVRAQVPDTTVAPADTVQTTPGPPVPAADPLPYAGVGWGEVVVPVLPILLPVLDPTPILGRMPGSFVYAFGAPGWPDAWSPYGLAPERVTLLLGAIPFDDLVTGRPRYDLLPLDFLTPLRVAPTRHGAPAAVLAHLRPYGVAEPLTELRYQSGGGGLQSIAALHVQQRRLRLFGRSGVLNVLGGFVGRTAEGAYPVDRGWGTRLRRERRLLVRLRYARPGWNLELRNLHNRRRLGAHGGVLPDPPDDFDSVYDPFGAAVRDPQARRQTIRNDLSLEARTRFLPGLAEPLTATAYWTAQLFRYRTAQDSLGVTADRVGFRVRQDLTYRGHRLAFQAAGWRERAEQSAAFVDSVGPGRARFHALVQDSLRLLGLDAALEGALHAGTGMPPFSGAVHLERRFGGFRLFAEGRHAGQPPSLVERYGFGAPLQGLGMTFEGRVQQGRAGLSLTAGPWDVLLFGFASRTTNAVDLYVLNADTAEVRAVPRVRRTGAGARIDWRRRTERGLYLSAEATALRQLDTASPELRRLQAALPGLFGRSRLGARFFLFRQDLDVDLYLEGRFWTGMRSRTLHPPTGLLALPGEDARRFGPSGTLDLFADMIVVQSATIFLGLENLLSGTPLTAGTLIVPVYPLPQRRFRFGVYWPIFG